MGLKHAVITSVARDELLDGGAAIWAETIRAVRAENPQTAIEVLIPDFKGRWQDLETVLAAKPDILNHNVETVPRLHKKVRPQAKYERSLEMLRRAKAAGFVTKIGPHARHRRRRRRDRRHVARHGRRQARHPHLGQYLRPSAQHLPLYRWVTPEEFRAVEAVRPRRSVFASSNRDRWCAVPITPMSSPTRCVVILK